MAKTQHESGGVLSANSREGFRSETLARFALSAFGPVSSVDASEDAGIDLVCATSSRQGKRLHVGPSYLVQVKSDPISEITFEGENAQEWLGTLGSPLFICCVDKRKTRLRLYSTWSVGRVLLQARSEGRTLSKLTVLTDQQVGTEQPAPESVPLGPAIVDFVLTDLADPEALANLKDCVERWVLMDTANIIRRRAGIAIAKGYTSWTPNKAPDETTPWYRPYYYSLPHAANARSVIFECATLIALLEEPNEKEALATYVKQFCSGEAEKDKWAKERLGL